MAATLHDAWVQGFLAAHYADRGERLPTEHPLEIPSHLVEDVEVWSPHHPRAAEDFA